MEVARLEVAFTAQRTDEIIQAVSLNREERALG